MKTEDVGYRDGSTLLRGFMAYDETLTGKRPGVLVVHEAWGLGNHTMSQARTLADLGYVAFAADMFGDRAQPSEASEAMTFIRSLRSDPKNIRARGRAALLTLASMPQVDTARLAGIGFCFGGTTVLELARDGADLRAVASFHGSLDTTAPAAKGQFKASVLVCVGADDPASPLAQVNAFGEEMTSAGTDWQLITYGGTVHSFTDPSADGVKNGAGNRYNERSSKRAWAAMTSFLREVL
jgi:dienelactone hydrolase